MHHSVVQYAVKEIIINKARIKNMVKFIESELVSLKKEVNEMWTLVYNQLDRAGEAVLTFNRDQAQQVIVREKRVNAFELKIDSDVED